MQTCAGCFTFSEVASAARSSEVAPCAWMYCCSVWLAVHDGVARAGTRHLGRVDPVVERLAEIQDRKEDHEQKRRDECELDHRCSLFTARTACPIRTHCLLPLRGP